MAGIPLLLLVFILHSISVRAASEKKVASDKAGFSSEGEKPKFILQQGGGMGGGNIVVKNAETEKVEKENKETEKVSKENSETGKVKKRKDKDKQQLPLPINQPPAAVDNAGVPINQPSGNSGLLPSPKLPGLNILCDLLKYPEKFLNATEDFAGGIPALLGGVNGTGGLLNLDLLKQLNVMGLLGNGSGILGLPGFKDIMGKGRELLSLVPGLGMKLPEVCKTAEECKFKDNGCMFKKTLGVKIGVCHPCSEKSKYEGKDQSVDGCGLDFFDIMLLVGLILLCILSLLLLTIIICMCISPCPLFKWRLQKYNEQGRGGREVGPAPTPRYQSNTSMDMESGGGVRHNSSGAKDGEKNE